MQTFEHDHNLFSRANAGDEQLFTVFYMGTVQDSARTAQEGRPIFNDVECVRIIVPGDKNSIIDRPAEASDKARFAKQYELFKRGLSEEEQVTGTRLTDWPYVSRAQCEELRYFGIKTVEQIANARDDVVSRMPGLTTLKQNAHVWLAKATQSAEAAQITKRLQDQDNEIASMREAMADQARRIEALMLEKQGAKRAA